MKFKTLMHVAVVVFLALSPAISQPQGPGPGGQAGEMLAGTVTSVGKDSVVVTPFSGGDPVTIRISDSTRITKERQPAKIQDIKPGDSVATHGNLNGKVMEADMLGVVPPEMAERLKQSGGRGLFSREVPGPGAAGFNPEDLGKKFIAGEVKAINETRLTIARPDGQMQDIEVDENTSFKRGNESITLADIKAGDFVRGPGELKDNTFTAKELRVGRGMRMQMRSDDATHGPDPPSDAKPTPAPPK